MVATIEGFHCNYNYVYTNMKKFAKVLNITHDCTYIFSHSQEVKVRLNSLPPPKALEKALAARFILTMASSSPDQPDIHFFFFAQHVRMSNISYC